MQMRRYSSVSSLGITSSAVGISSFSLPPRYPFLLGILSSSVHLLPCTSDSSPPGPSTLLIPWPVPSPPSFPAELRLATPHSPCLPFLPTFCSLACNSGSKPCRSP